MPTRGEAFQSFVESFGLPAYAQTSVPDDAELPYITYSVYAGYFGDPEAECTLDVWYLTESEAVLNAKAEEIAQAIGHGGLLIQCEGGGFWVKRGSPFSQPVETETNVRRRLINISIEFLTP